MRMGSRVVWALTAGWLVMAALSAAVPVALSVTAIADRTVQLTVAEGGCPKVGTRWTDAGHDLVGEVAAVDGRLVTLTLDHASATLRLGDMVRLTADKTVPAAGPAPTGVLPVLSVPTVEGRVSRVDGAALWVAGSARPLVKQPGELRREGAGFGQVVWDGDGDPSQGWSGAWRAEPGAGSPRLGDVVRYIAQPASVRAAAPVAATHRKPTPSGADNMVSVDDPVMRLLEALAGRGMIAGAGRRQFAGAGVASYTRLDIARFLAPTLAQLVDDDSRWPVQSMDSATAAMLRGVVRDYQSELALVGTDPRHALQHLDTLVKPGLHVLATAGVDGSVSSDKDAFDGRARASVFAGVGPQLTFSGTVSTESLGAMPSGRDRTTLDTYWLQWRPSRSFTLGAGRASFRLGSGYNDLLWSDRALSPDRLMLDWRLSLFGRPLRIEENVGYFDNNGARVVALRRIEYQPWRPLTIAVNEGLVTDRASQGLAALALPLYAVRFVSGKSANGGYGNYVGSLEATLRATRQWSVYGEFFLDDFDFSPSPPRTATRRGWLGGVQYTPAGALPGTSYRFEAAILPDTGTYLGQQDRGMSWTRGGYLLGHEYGEDSSGWRFSARQRMSPKLDLRLAAEHFTQLRESPVSPSTTRLEVGAGYNLTRWWSLGMGYRYERRTSIGAIAGNDRTDNGVYLETRAGY